MNATTPMVHSNGDSGKELLRIHREALDALRAAETAVSALLPDARNFYCKNETGRGPTAYEQARTQHVERMGQIRDMWESIMETAIEISDQE